MLRAVEVWSDMQTGSYIQAKSTGHGRCALEFHLSDAVMTIQSSKKAFISAAVGAKTHFASDDGACEIARQGETLRITVQQWRGGKEQVELDRMEFEIALRNLTDVEAPRITLL